MNRYAVASSSLRVATIMHPRSGGCMSRPHRVLVLGAMGILLSSCATIRDAKDWLSSGTRQRPVVAKTGAPTPPVPPPPRQKPTFRDAIKLEQPERLVQIDPNSLVGLNPSAVEKLLGAPSLVSKSDMSLVWTYAASGCSFQVFFYPDLKTTTFHALKYGGIDASGAQIAITQDCVRSILTAKSDAPG